MGCGEGRRCMGRRLVRRRRRCRVRADASGARQGVLLNEFSTGTAGEGGRGEGGGGWGIEGGGGGKIRRHEGEPVEYSHGT
jgi:hypothetical protein